jgi:hypothetical protein
VKGKQLADQTGSKERKREGREKALVKLMSRDLLWLDPLNPVMGSDIRGKHLLAKRSESLYVEDPALTN